MEKVNAYIAKQIWQSISTELDNARMQEQKFASAKDQFEFLIGRADELLQEYIGGEETED